MTSIEVDAKSETGKANHGAKEGAEATEDRSANQAANQSSSGRKRPRVGSATSGGGRVGAGRKQVTFGGVEGATTAASGDAKNNRHGKGGGGGARGAQSGDEGGGGGGERTAAVSLNKFEVLTVCTIFKLIIQF